MWTKGEVCQNRVTYFFMWKYPCEVELSKCAWRNP